mmetsp:Transcript_38258/g.70762  ORF Transcript_38258/g.70762 Transcript_38258/m.70762 type:complete len:260 (+) Transcript_38258:42-821(+)
MQCFLVAAVSGFLVLRSVGASGILSVKSCEVLEHPEADEKISWQHDQRSCMLHVLLQRGRQLAVDLAVRDKSKLLTEGCQSHWTGHTMLQISKRKKKLMMKVAPIREGNSSATPAKYGSISAKASMSMKVPPLWGGNTSATATEEGSTSAKASMSTKVAPIEEGDTSDAPVEEGNTSPKASMSTKELISMLMVMSMAFCMACAAALAMAAVMPTVIWFVDGGKPEIRQERQGGRRVRFAGGGDMESWDSCDSVIFYRPD